EGVLMKGVDSSYNQLALKRSLVKGDTLDFKDNPNTQLLISEYFANRLGLEVGDKFIMYFIQEPIRKRPFTVKGIYTSHAEELDKTYVIGSLDLIRRLNNLNPGEVGAYQIRLHSFDSLDVASRAINEVLPIELNATNIVEQMPD